MRKAPYEISAPKQTVSLTLNSDLYTRAKSAGINASRVAEEALACAYAELRAASLRAELEQDLAAASVYAAEHGSFADLVRAHYDSSDAAI